MKALAAALLGVLCAAPALAQAPSPALQAASQMLQEAQQREAIALTRAATAEERAKLAEALLAKQDAEAKRKAAMPAPEAGK